MARTKQQYNEFRKAFKKWCQKYRPRANSVTILQSPWHGEARLWYNDTLIAEYHAPDYVNYMKYTLRGVGK